MVLVGGSGRVVVGVESESHPLVSGGARGGAAVERRIAQARARQEWRPPLTPPARNPHPIMPLIHP